MMRNPQNTFDDYASDYDAALSRGISVSGENKHYFAQRRLEWLRDCIGDSSVPLRRVMDFGCGTGSSSPFFSTILGAQYFIGADKSARALEIAKHEHGSKRTQFILIDTYTPCDDLDLVFCNGVFHHISPQDRPAAIDFIFAPCGLGVFLRFGKTIPGIPERVM